MADHSKPLVTSTYANFVTELDGRFDDLAKGLDPATTTPTNLPTGSIRWNSASSKWEKWSGSAWADLASAYNINLSGPLTLTANSASTAFLITQTGAGAAFVVEDSANPDSTPFIIDTSGNVGIGTGSPAYKLDVLGSFARLYSNSSSTSAIFATGRTSTFGESQFGTSGTSGGISSSSVAGDTVINANNVSGRILFGINGSTKALLDTAGNLGLGVTPSAWAAASGAGIFQVGNQGAYLFGGGTGWSAMPYIYLGDNGYYNSGWKYTTTNAATQYSQNAGKHIWYTAPSGTAGTAITFTQAMTLDASGYLLLGDTAPDWSAAGRGLLEVNGSSTSLVGLKTGSTRRGYFSASSTITELASETNPLLFTVNAAERMRLDASGNLGLGVTPSAWGSIFKAIQTSGGVTFSGRTDTQQLNASVNWYYDGGTNRYIANGFASRYFQESGAHQWHTAPSGTAGNAITFTQAMTLDASGNLGVGTSSPTFGSGSGIEIERSGSNATLRLQRTTSSTSTVELRADASASYLETRDSTPLIFGIDAVEKIRITSAGNLAIGTTSAAVKLVVSSTDAVKLPVGTTAQRPTGSSGYIRFNSDLSKFEGYNGSAWTAVGGGATGGGSDAIFVENGQTVTTNYTITAGNNAGTFGPISIASGVTVTVPSGSVWTVV